MHKSFDVCVYNTYICTCACVSMCNISLCRFLNNFFVIKQIEIYYLIIISLCRFLNNFFAIKQIEIYYLIIKLFWFLFCLHSSTEEVPSPKAKSYYTILCLDTSDSMTQHGAFDQMKQIVEEFINGQFS